MHQTLNRNTYQILKHFPIIASTVVKPYSHDRQ